MDKSLQVPDNCIPGNLASARVMYPPAPPLNLIFQLVFLWCCSDLSKQAALHREGKNKKGKRRDREVILYFHGRNTFTNRTNCNSKPGSGQRMASRKRPRIIQKKKKRYLKVFALWGIEREMCTSHFSHDITLHTTQEHSKVNRNIFNQLNVFFLK